MRFLLTINLKYLSAKLMNTIEKIRTVIIDDNEEYLFTLQESLSFFPEIDFLGGAAKYVKAKSLLLDKKPDLVFLDIEMPCKNGFELLHEVREKGCHELNVIFYTAYDKYVIQALRESAFDYLLKPFKIEELKGVIHRFMTQREVNRTNYQKSIPQIINRIPDIVAMPNSTGIRFADKGNIVLIQCVKDNLHSKPVWSVLENSGQQFKLRQGITAKDILNILGGLCFVIINQSTIVNLSYVAGLEFKSRECVLLPPFNRINLVASRSYLAGLKDRFDIF